MPDDLDDEPARPTWVVIDSDSLLEMLRRCHDGADPDLVLLESYANAETPPVEHTVACAQHLPVLIELAVVLGVAALVVLFVRP